MSKKATVQIRLTDSEKAGFEQAAELAGVPLSAWVRERLRLAAVRELADAGQRAPFIPHVPIGATHGD